MSESATTTIRPGLLVSLKTSLRGNIIYDRRDIEPEHEVKGGALKAVWETQRVITDPVEFAAGSKVRDKARAMIKGACIWSAFGLLCPDGPTTTDDTDDMQQRSIGNLDRAVADARKLCLEFNATSKLTKVDIYVITGRIARDDVEAARALKSEVRELMMTMEEGLKNLNVKAVREAAARLRGVGQMLSDENKAKVTIAVNAARKAAKEAVKAAEAGEQAAIEVDLVTIKKIAEQRTAFLDLDEAGEVATPTNVGRAVDFETEPSAAEVGLEPPKITRKKSTRQPLEVE